MPQLTGDLLTPRSSAAITATPAPESSRTRQPLVDCLRQAFDHSLQNAGKACISSGWCKTVLGGLWREHGERSLDYRR